jgi:hypothetical protein
MAIFNFFPPISTGGNSLTGRLTSIDLFGSSGLGGSNTKFVYLLPLL